MNINDTSIFEEPTTKEIGLYSKILTWNSAYPPGSPHPIFSSLISRSHLAPVIETSTPDSIPKTLILTPTPEFCTIKRVPAIPTISSVYHQHHDSPHIFKH